MDEQTFIRLLDDNRQILHKICRLYRDNREDRQDLYQEIVYQLWRSIPGYLGQAKPSTWIYRVALNTALTAFRKKKPDITYPATLPEYSSADPPEHEALLFTALGQLNDAEKALMTLYLEDLSYSDIAAITGMDENHVGVKLYRIRQKLKNILQL